MRSFCLSLFLFSLYFSSLAQPSHESWSALLKKHVSAAGVVNYDGIKADKASLDSYLKTLQNNPVKDAWSREEKMSYWINAYNAFTIQLILKNYPLKSINDIQEGGKKPWDIPFIKIGDKAYTLNNIEHDILRKQFEDPRIHFAVNCASYSCPPLLNQAFDAEKLDAQLNLLAKRFINDSNRNKISAQSVQLSEIFNWFKADFTKNGTLIDFLNRYAAVKINANAKVTYLPYNWNLNN